MQPNTIFQVAGLLICGVTFAWFGVGLVHGAQQILLSKRRFQLDQELIQRQIAAVSTIAKSKRQTGWDGLRRFRIKWKVRESRDCHSFYLVPHDGKPLPGFLPGQYITLSLRQPNESKPLVRCYSLSERPRDDHYRLTVKKVSYANGGVGKVSRYLNDVAKEGDLLAIRSPSGPFCLDPSQDTPVVLLAGGIGITPLNSMLNAIVEAEVEREVYLFYGVRNGTEHTFREALRAINQESPTVNIVTCYSQPTSSDAQGTDYDVKGHVTIDLLREYLPSNNFDFFICGPGPFTTTLVNDLLAWHVPEAAIHFEAFGPAKPKRNDSPQVEIGTSVEFAQSDCKTTWSDACETLLELAEKNGVNIDSGCRTGSCGTCVTAIKQGKVKHTEPPSATIDEGTCLPCIAVPNGPIVLDA